MEGERERGKVGENGKIEPRGKEKQRRVVIVPPISPTLHKSVNISRADITQAGVVTVTTFALALQPFTKKICTYK